jgi:hypothetical protein
MWTPLLLICYVDSIDCAIPNAPAYMTEEQCLLALDDVLKTLHPTHRHDDHGL